ncbi:MAG: hypothetical protein LBK58_05900 [Prevotellaceae bacterium]|jgi:hypothetical protein|nr:hypothetical protein [Prevotellaceae bacterium]
MENKNEILRNIVQMRMETKSLLEYYRGLSELSGKSYEKEINALLDKINRLDKLEEELKK